MLPRHGPCLYLHRHDLLLWHRARRLPWAVQGCVRYLVGSHGPPPQGHPLVRRPLRGALRLGSNRHPARPPSPPRAPSPPCYSQYYGLYLLYHVHYIENNSIQFFIQSSVVRVSLRSTEVVRGADEQEVGSRASLLCAVLGLKVHRRILLM